MNTQHSGRLLAVGSLMAVLLSPVLFSFTSDMGVDSYAIYLNNELLVRSYVTREAGLEKISLKPSNSGDVLKIQYSHCGKVGVERRVVVRDNHGVLKTWRFTDGAEMKLGVRDLLGVSDDYANMKLVYASRELPEGVVLAKVAVTDDNKASLR